HGREALRVCLDPIRRITRTRVLPRCKPDQHEPHISLSCLVDLVVNERKIKFALFSLDQFPAYGAYHRVEVKSGEFVPYRSHVLDVRSARVMQFTGERDERLVVDE